MTFRRIFQDQFADRRVTLLGAGPMSIRVTDAIIDLANYYRRNIAMIPSRRQIDASNLGGGYVNSWSTESFVKYVRARDAGSYVLLARDHSGPWQLSKEKAGVTLSHSEAMDEVKDSLEVDIKVGFDLIHIDPSPGLEMGRNQDQVEDDILELLEFCQSRDGSKIEYEVGADEQSQVPDYVHVAEASLQRVLSRVKRAGLRAPLFYVLQTGTKVMETRNIGSFDSPIPVQGMLNSSVQLPEVIRMCRRHAVFLKEHNADYLSDEALAWHPRYGVHAANVAPEFGVVETRTLLSVARELNASDFLNEFQSHALAAGKWKKWMVANSTASDQEKIDISGHYHFSDPALMDGFARLYELAHRKSMDLDRILRSAVRVSIDRYLRNFRYGLRS